MVSEMTALNYATTVKYLNDAVNETLDNIIFHLLKLVNHLNVEFLI